MLTSNNKCLICGKDHGNLPCPDAGLTCETKDQTKKEPVYSRTFLCALAAVARMGATVH